MIKNAESFLQFRISLYLCGLYKCTHAYTRVRRIIDEEINYSGLKKFSNIQTLICIRTIARAMVLALLLLLGLGESSAAEVPTKTEATSEAAAQPEAEATSAASIEPNKVTPSFTDEWSEEDRPNALRGIEVHFRFDKSRLDLDYMNNAQSLDNFARVIDSLGLAQIDSVLIVSQSSPEGVYEHNLRLSQRRAATMRRVIEERHPELSDKLFVHPDGESWQRLREYVVKDSLMKQSTIDKVLAVIDADVNIGTKKWRMEQLDIYPYLRKTYYPRIRNSVFCIVYFDDGLSLLVAEQPKRMETEEVAEEPVFRDDFPSQNSITYREPILHVHSNLLYDAVTVANIGIEYYPHNSRYTIAANYTAPWWGSQKNHRYLQAIDGELEVRRYFEKPEGFDAEKGLSGHYLAAYGQANLYDIAFDATKRGWQGEGWGLGLGYGYVWQPWKDKRWKVEAFVRFGYYQSLYDPYHASDPFNGKYYYDWDGKIEDFIRRNHRLRWFGPTGIGINLSYDIFMRKVKLER